MTLAVCCICYRCTIGYRMRQRERYLQFDDFANTHITLRENEAFPQVNFQRDLFPEEADCCVCLLPFEENASVRKLPCTHVFHAECIGKYQFNVLS